LPTKKSFAELIDVFVEASAGYLLRQFEAGVDALQIFSGCPQAAHTVRL
jgi:uroporphyrinogen-III decarboxylase